MPSTPHSLMSYLRVVAGAFRDDPRNDSELLTRFAEGGDEVAFQALIWRHGLLVWRVCHRILNDRQDTEDAFQATFLALTRKSRRFAIKNPAGWLHQVARQTALDIRAAARRRRNLEHQLHAEALPKAEDASQTEQYAVMDEELAGLPEKLRVTLVLHYLEEKTQDEVARILGCSQSTVQRRLTQAETALRKRLGQRGLTASAVSLAALLKDKSGALAVPNCLIESTARAAVVFRAGTLNGEISIAAENLLQSLMMKGAVQKLWWLALLCVGLTCIGGIGLVVWVIHGDGSNEAKSTVSTTSSPTLPVKSADRPIKRVDCFGDSLPDGAIARIGTVRFRPGFVKNERSSNVAFLPDGKTFVSVHGTNKVFFWDVLTGRELRSLPSSFDCTKVAVTLDGKKMATCGSGQVKVWSLTYDPPKLLWEQTLPYGPDSLVFSPTGEKLAVGVAMNDLRYCFYFFDAAKGVELQELNGRRNPTGRSKVLSYSPDNKLLAIDGELYNATTGAKLCDLITSGGINATSEISITYQNFSADGKKLVAESEQGEQRLCHVWDTATRAELWKIESSKNALAAFTPDSQSVLEIRKSGWDTQICFWNLVTGKAKSPTKSLGNFPIHGLAASDLCLSSDGKLLAGGRKTGVSVWDVSTGQEVGAAGCPQEWIHSLAFAQDGKKLATLSGVARIDLWDTDTGRQLQKLEQFHSYTSNLVSFGDHFMAMCGLDGSNRLVITWDPCTGKALCIPRPSDVDSLKKVIPVSRDWIKKLSNGPPQTICTPPMRRQAFTTDCRWHLWAAPDSTITLMDRSTGKVARQLTGVGFSDDELIRFMAVSVDGQTILCCHSIDRPQGSMLKEPCQINVWSTATGKELIDFKTRAVYGCLALKL